jgi:phage repressor protein C with HTH and peptisase S24 domain
MAVGSNKSLGNRLREARIGAGYRSMAAAAERVGKTQSTYRAHENGQNDFDSEHAQQYAEAFGVSAEWLLFGGDLDYRTWLKSKSDSPQAPSSPHTLRIAGEVAAGLWLESGMFEEDAVGESVLTGGDRRFPLNHQYLLRIKGESLNKIAQDGDLILCLDYFEAGIELKSGDIVVVERSRDGGHTIERTAKRVVRHNGEIELRPESTDPRFQEPVIFNDHSEEASEVRIIAKVLGAFRQFE